jgi:hypothetical protein
MKTHLKTAASVLVVLAVGALVLSEVPALHGQSSGSTKLSCSSPEVIDTFRVMALRRSQNPDRDVSITNIGTLGLLGNEILCSGDLNGAPGTYSLLPLDDGRFKVTITSILGHYNYSGLSFHEIGPVNYLEEKKKLEDELVERKKIQELREVESKKEAHKAQEKLQDEISRKLSVLPNSSPCRNNLKLYEIDDCIKRMKSQEEVDAQIAREKAQREMRRAEQEPFLEEMRQRRKDRCKTLTSRPPLPGHLPMSYEECLAR